MLIKAGVDISKLKRPMRRALNKIARTLAAVVNEELIITSTYEGNHSESSLHYCDEAIDIRQPAKPDLVVQELKRTLGRDFDIVPERDHIHIEYDPD